MKFKIEHEEQDLQFIGNLLAQCPFGKVRHIVESIEAQVKAQMQELHDSAADIKNAPSGASTNY